MEETTTIEMKSGYRQVEVKEAQKEITVLSVSNLGVYEYVKMPFRLTYTPATYQQLTEECLGDYNITVCHLFG